MTEKNKVCNTPENQLARLKLYRRRARDSMRSLQSTLEGRCRMVERLISDNMWTRERMFQQQSDWRELRQELEDLGQLEALSAMRDIENRRSLAVAEVNKDKR